MRDGDGVAGSGRGEIAADPRADGGPTGRMRTPLWVVGALTGLGSLSTGAAINGIYFVTEREFGYGDAANLALAVVVGLAYVAAALTAGPVFTRLRARLSQWAAVACILAGMGLLCFLPVLWPTPVAVWIFCILNSILSGWFWPLVESYVSGGRRGAALRRATGVFNVSWASAVAVSFWLMQPLLALAPLSVLAALGCVLLGTLCLVPLLTPHAAPHGEGGHVHSPDEVALYRCLLGVCRCLLVMSYLLMSIVTPLLPSLIEAVGVREGSRTVFASTWMVSRVLTFAFMQSTHRWHGVRTAPALFAAVMVLGFIGCLVATGPLGLAASLAVFGAALGAIYAAAIYYALEVGAAEVDAGGRHEALIGLGYAGGPAAGLAALGVATLLPDAGPGAARVILIGAALLVTGALSAVAWRIGRRAR